MQRKLLLSLSLALALPLASSCSSARKGVQIDVPSGSGTGNDQVETIAILGTNDIHGALSIDTLKSREANGAPSVEYPVGGVATIASYVKVLRQELGERLLWLDGGDEFQGTIESNQEKGKSMVRFFNLAGLDGAAIGNHEFDYGPEHPESEVTPGAASDLLGALKARMSEAQFKYLAANIVNAGTQQLASFPNTLPRAIYSTGKVRVGVIGLSTLDTPKTTRPTNVKSLAFTNLKEATLREAKALREEGADVVVITSHVGLKCDLGRAAPGHQLRKPTDPLGECGPKDELVQLLRSLPQGTVDAVVAGHSHQIVHHWVAGVPVIQSGALGRYLTVLYLSYDLKNRRLVTDLTRIEGPIPVCPLVFKNQNDCNGERPAPPPSKGGRGPLVASYFHGKKIEPDPAVLEMLRPAVDKAAAIKREVVGEAARPIEPDRQKESPLGNLVADSVRAAAGADVALVNAGGIRAPIEQGKITYGSVFRVLPFDNVVVSLKVTGKELLQILRIAQSGSRGFCPTSGLKLRVISPEYDAPANDLNGDGKIDPWEINRLIDVRLADGAKIQESKTYTLATIDFLVAGGDDVGWALSKVPLDRQTHHNVVIRDAAVKQVRSLSAKGPIHSASQPLLDQANPRLKFEKPVTKKAVKRRRTKKT